jgi:hypothetical protein
MGKQITFYMTEADENEFLEFLRTDDGVHILRSRTPKADAEVLDELPDCQAPWGFEVMLWNKRISPPPKLRFVTGHMHYIVDPMPSEVIEFLRSRMYERRLVRGRLWVELNGWDQSDPSILIRKGAAFSQWFTRLSRWITRRSVRHHAGDYFMPGAARFVEGGGRVCQEVYG